MSSSVSLLSYYVSFISVSSSLGLLSAAEGAKPGDDCSWNELLRSRRVGSLKEVLREKVGCCMVGCLPMALFITFRGW